MVHNHLQLITQLYTDFVVVVTDTVRYVQPPVSNIIGILRIRVLWKFESPD